MQINNKYIKALIIPFVLLCFILSVGLLWNVLGLPDKDAFILIIKKYFETYGVWLVLLAAIAESALVLGAYAPGSMVIFLGVILSVGNPPLAVAVVTATAFGFMIGFSFDYMLGRYGWYKLFMHLGFEKSLIKTKNRLEKYKYSMPWIGYSNPDLGSLVATSYGILGFTYFKFIKVSLLPNIIWCMFWGIAVYMLGDNALSVMGYKAALIFIAVLAIARVVEVKYIEKY